MSTKPRSGPITRDELLALWGQTNDPLYTQAFTLHPETSGIEAHEQAMEQLARASRAVDRTTQAMFLLPWSGQSDAPAGGEARATCTLKLQRSKRLDQPLRLSTGLRVEDAKDDASSFGGVQVLTGRRYRLRAEFTFNPGEAGPFLVEAEAERPGYGYNNPLPGDISVLLQPGGALHNHGASTHAHRLTVPDRVDVVVPDNVSQYVAVTAGANAGRQWRAVGYVGPSPGVGGSLQLEQLAALEGTTGGTFAPGETVVLSDVAPMPHAVLAKGRLVKQTASGGFAVVTLLVDSGAVQAGGTLHLVGQASGADLLVQTVLLDPREVDSDDETWAILDWGADLGLTVENVDQPSGGRSNMLDTLGEERNLPRSPGEGDDHYRHRVAELGDVVSPNAVRRAANRVLGPLGFSACLREVGLQLLPGLYLDRDALDNDFAARPEDRFRLLLDYTSFRAFFLVGVPPLDWGEFGFAYDAGGSNAYDAAPFPAAYDGFPLTASRIYREVWQAVDAVKAGGVGWELYQEKLGCF